VNGAAVRVRTNNGHLELDADTLRAGANVVTVGFTKIAPAGKPITRYEDKGDCSEYIYTLFVPMDASMAFPCFDQPDLKGQFTPQQAANKISDFFRPMPLAIERSFHNSPGHGRE
jgi:aminopeptidase N